MEREQRGQIIQFPDRQDPNDRLPRAEPASIISVDFASKSREGARPNENNGTASWVRYFDRYGQKEGLSKDWYNLTTKGKKQVGFVTKNQMLSLKDPDDNDALENWTQQTVRDIEGFKLEFLSKHNVYTREYHRNPNDPTRLEDPMYGNNKDGNHPDIVEITSEEERGGSVKDSLQKAKEFLLNSPAGSMAVIESPLGPTGFKDNDGRGRDYTDSYFTILLNQGETIMNYTIKTDFKLPQMRDAILKLTGREIEQGAPLEDYVRSITLIKPGTQDGPQNIFDVVGILEQIQPSHAFRDPKGNQETRSWRHVYDDIVQGENLYDFDARTKKIISDFAEFARNGGLSLEELQKGAAATILRMSEDYFRLNRQNHGEVTLEKGRSYNPRYIPPDTMGRILEKTAEIRGCSGGGEKSKFAIFGSLIPRWTTPGGGGGVGSDEHGSLEFKCNRGHSNTRPKGQLIPKCQVCGDSVAC